MLHVFICEDNPQHRARMEAIVRKHISTEDCEMELVLSAGCPTDILDYLETHSDTNGFYFLDVDLQHDISGIELAAKIRNVDTHATIVFITTHEELSYLVFKHKIEAMDYIIKDRPADIEERMTECMLVAYRRYLETRASKRKHYSVRVGDHVWNIPFDEILFFETDSSARHQIILHTKDSRIRFRGFINEIAKTNPDFYLCHRAYLVNTKNIKHINTSQRVAEMVNGEVVLIANRKIKELLALLNA